MKELQHLMKYLDSISELLRSCCVVAKCALSNELTFYLLFGIGLFKADKNFEQLLCNGNASVLCMKK